MAATHPRRRKQITRAESATYAESQLGTNNKTRVNAEFVLAFDAPNLTAIQLVHRILQISGPYTSGELTRMCEEKYGRKYSIQTIETAIRNLKKLGLVVRLNGGYAAHNWDQIGIGA